MEYNLPFPDVTYRHRYILNDFHKGDVLAFEYNQRTGIVFMEDSSFFTFAVNLYEDEGRIWTSDEVPEGMSFYESTWEERVWAMEKYLELESHRYYFDNQEEPLIKFIENNCPKGDRYNMISHEWDFCFNFLSVAPWFQLVKSRDEMAKSIWKETRRGIEDTGLQYDANKTELYCFFMGILMISQHDQNAVHYVDKLRRNWDQFSWMYGMVIGRIVGTKLNTFTSIVNALSNHGRVGYLHLYLPLIEKNIDKICNYSTKEKKWKLEGAIAKMRKEEQLQEQHSDLDDLYQILFPSYFQESMSANRPAASIRELKKELVENTKLKDENQKRIDAQQVLIHEQTKLINDQKIEINELLLYREAAEKLTRNYTDDAISIDELKQAIDAIKDPDKAQQFYFQLNYILRKNPAWKKHEDEFADFIDAKMNARERQSNDLITSMKEVASRPTHYHAAGSTYQDKSKQLHIDSSADVNPSKLLK